MENQRMRETVERLQQALDNMRQAASSQQAGTPQSEADARRAAEQLKEAEQALSALRNQQSGGKVDDLARQAEELAQRQQEFEGQLRRAVTGGQQGQGQGQNRQQQGLGRMTQQEAQQLYEQRSKETDDVKRLEQQMQTAVRDLASTQPKASGKLRDALGQMQQQELPRDMQRNGEYIRRGLGEYAVLSESMITQGMNNLRDQLHGVQQMLAQSKEGKEGKEGKGAGGDDKENKAVEQALSQVERLRQQIEALQQRQAQTGQNGQQGGQQNSQGGQQGQSGQQGGQNGQGGNQGGYQQGSLSRNGQPNGPNGGPFGPNGGARYGPYGGLWYNNPNLPPEGAVRADVDREYKETLTQLERLQGQLTDDPNTAKDLQALVREMQRMNPWTYSNDGELNSRIQAAVVADIERVELELRRRVDEAGGGSTRSAGTEAVPQGFADAVAEYFRKLSSSK